MTDSEFITTLQQSEEGIKYLNLIDSCSNRSTPLEVYEEHHIQPKSLGGTNDRTNLIKLSCVEHLQAHSYLAGIFGGKLLYAFNQMLNTRSLPESEENLIKDVAKLREQGRKAVGEYIRKNRIWEKSLETKLEKYGEVWVNAHTSEAEERRVQTKIDRFGSKMGHCQTESAREKRKSSLRTKYGTTMGACHTQEAEVKARVRRQETMLKRYGSTTMQLHTVEAKEKAKASRKAYYDNLGVSPTAATHSPEAQAKRSNTRKLKKAITILPEYLDWWESHKGLFFRDQPELGVRTFLVEKNQTLLEFTKQNGIQVN